MIVGHPSTPISTSYPQEQSGTSTSGHSKLLELEDFLDEELEHTSHLMYGQPFASKSILYPQSQLTAFVGRQRNEDELLDLDELLDGPPPPPPPPDELLLDLEELLLLLLLLLDFDALLELPGMTQPELHSSAFA